MEIKEEIDRQNSSKDNIEEVKCIQNFNEEEKLNLGINSTILKTEISLCSESHMDETIEQPEYLNELNSTVKTEWVTQPEYLNELNSSVNTEWAAQPEYLNDLNSTVKTEWAPFYHKPKLSCYKAKDEMIFIPSENVHNSHEDSIDNVNSTNSDETLNIVCCKKYKCNICNKEFKHKSNLIQHLVLHTDKKEFKCNICKKEFKYKCTLQQHLVLHTDKKEFKCNICKKEFYQKSNLKQHLVMHTDKKEFKCNICKKEFNQLFHFEEHINNIHSTRRYECARCTKQYYYKGSLKKHLNNCPSKKIHLRKYKYYSPSNISQNRYQSEQRMSSSREEYYECERCHFKFKNVSHLNIHRNSYDLKVFLAKL